MQVDHIELRDFRNFEHLDLRPVPTGLTVVIGGNGSGKTSLLEAIGYAARLQSFRDAPREALVREGTTRAVVRGETRSHGRSALVEIEIAPPARDVVLLNRHRPPRTDSLAKALVVTVFTPDDLVLVKGAPSARRAYLDEVLAASSARGAELRRTVDRILRQRGALLRQAGGRLTEVVASTLDVWDLKLSEAGEALALAREELVERVAPHAAAAFAHLASTTTRLRLTYQRSWPGHLGAALAAARPDDVRRGVSTTGPHRDDLLLSLGDLDARTRLSQGRQRCTTLALRLASHEVLGEVIGARPVLLLDDAFSELDNATSHALLERLPPGQALLTTAGGVPEGAAPAQVLRIEHGRLV